MVVGHALEAGFELRDNLHGADLWGATDGAGGKGGPHHVVGGMIGAELAGHVGDDVHDVAVALDDHLLGDLDRVVFGNPADITAAVLGSPEMFGAVLQAVAADPGIDMIGLPMAAVNQGRTRADEWLQCKWLADSASALPELVEELCA